MTTLSTKVDVATTKMSKLKLKGKCYQCGGDHACGKAECTANSLECSQKGHFTRACLSKEDSRRSDHKHKHRHDHSNSHKQKHEKHHKQCDYKKQWSGKHHWHKVHEVRESSNSESHVLAPLHLVTVLRRGIPTQKQFTSLPVMIEPIQIQFGNVIHGTEINMDLMDASDIKFEAKVDTGAQANIMPLCVFNRIIVIKSYVRPPTVQLQGYMVNSCKMKVQQ